MNRKRIHKPESPTIAEALQFIEHEVSRVLASSKEDWGRKNTYPGVSISLGCPNFCITPYLHSPALDSFVDGIFRQIGIIPCRDTLRGHFFLPLNSVDKFKNLHRAEILSFLGKESDTVDEPSESFGGPLEGPAGHDGGGE
ncbi:MAG: hypothetical protein LBK83_11480 [Treponema sp.]|jgi:hypothetical protein|nr:hypothetical protein [Treponema sp.]